MDTRTFPAIARALAFLAALAFAGAGYCGGASESLLVSATVMRHASIRANVPASITVTESDLARGYMEVAAPLELTVRSNAPEGYTLVFERQGDQVRAARVNGLSMPLLVGSEQGATTSRPAPGRGLWTEVLQLRFRFELEPGARPGQHPWPLNISLMSQ